MRTLSLIKTIILVQLILSLSCCTPKPESTQEEVTASAVEFTVQPAPEWTALFKRSSGWFGGDGIFAIPYTGVDAAKSAEDSILFIFSDTMVGEIENGKLEPGYVMVNNSVMILNGNEPDTASAKFLVNRKAKNVANTLFTPETPLSGSEDYYWLGDGFLNHQKDSSIYIFAHRIINTKNKDDFPFREIGNSLIIIPRHSKYPFEDHRQIDIPFSTVDPAQPGPDTAYNSLGVGVLANTVQAGAANPDGYVYVYGTRGKAKELIAARVKGEDMENFSAWKFWNGSGWTDHMENSAMIEDSVANELSVTPIGNNQYALVYQYGGIFPTIYMQVGPTPVGPFGPKKLIWNTSDDVNAGKQFTYNAKAHPAISKPGELLVSYNVNSFDFFNEIGSEPNLYRPRFVRIKFQ